MKALFTILFTIVVLTTSAQTKSIQVSPPLSEGSPTKTGMSGERLALINKLFNEAVEKDKIPGAVALIARNGKIVYHKAFGLADSKSGRKLKRDDIFRIASQTKAITSTAVMILWEEGKFKLDDPISKYIPEFKDAGVLDSFNADDSTFTTTPIDKPITIRHLLTHTSGIGYGMIDGDKRFRKIYKKAGVIDAFTTEPVTIEENIKKLAKLPLHHNPGEKFTYSEGLDVLGYFIEIVSGLPFDKFLRTRLFDPLGMDDTWFYLPESKYKRMVSVQEKKNGKWTKHKHERYDADYPIKGAKMFFSGGAGLSSTAKDYATFLQMYLNNGELNGTRILSRTTIQVIMANQIGDIWEGTGRHHGLAFEVINKIGQDQGGRGSAGTFDWGGYFNTQYFADPKEQIIGILMKQTQGKTTDDTGWRFRQLIGQAVDD
jgi:CubicO group peptidase (beta-lactamase class C family)